MLGVIVVVVPVRSIIVHLKGIPALRGLHTPTASTNTTPIAITIIAIAIRRLPLKGKAVVAFHRRAPTNE